MWVCYDKSCFVLELLRNSESIKSFFHCFFYKFKLGLPSKVDLEYVNSQDDKDEDSKGAFNT